MDSIKSVLTQKRSDLAIIPGGMTNLLKPLDVAVNIFFKDVLREKKNTWMLKGAYLYTTGGNRRTSLVTDITKLIADTHYNMFATQMTINSATYTQDFTAISQF
ncbi:hypothetical protein HZS_2148 [Henneguya salminicola]|nr:hypothetical protein HZS_2148 [Henneguya salminicola]